MDALISAAARALARGDALGALQRVALRDDAAALALRGIAMAQLGDLPRARVLLRRAARAFVADRDPRGAARCAVAAAEVALAQRELGGSRRVLDAATVTLERHGDRRNAAQAQLILSRRALLLGHLGEADAALSRLPGDVLDAVPALAAVAALVEAELGLRRLRIGPAQQALDRAGEAALRAGIPALQAEVRHARQALDRPAARQHSAGRERALLLREVCALLESGALVVDAGRRVVRAGAQTFSLARRPVLFALALGLAEAWPQAARREALIESAFRQRRPDDTHRARLRVEIGRLRIALRAIARIEATPQGFVLRPHTAPTVSVLQPPIAGAQAALLALLADGAAWSTSALALAVNRSQRTVQRALSELLASGQVRCVGNTRAQRWLAPPLADFTTILLLPASLPSA